MRTIIKIINKRIAVLVLLITICATSFAAQSYSSNTSHYQLNKAGRLVNLNQQEVSYPCTAGGELLVVYGTPVNNQQYISSHTTIYPLYVKPGFEATPLYIPDNQRSAAISRSLLNVSTLNPPVSTISFNLRQRNQDAFYVNSVNSPMAKTNPAITGTLQKRVSMMQAFINGERTSSKHSSYPEYNYNYLQDSGLIIFEMVKNISGAIATWNQNGLWTNGKLGRHRYPIQYNFTPQASDDPNFYNGMGFWVCGSVDAPQQNLHVSQRSISYNDKLTS